MRDRPKINHVITGEKAHATGNREHHAYRNQGMLDANSTAAYI
jgi:hypothetical protein